MYQPQAHHVLWFLGTFITLWAVSLSVRGFLHRSRVAGARRGERGPRRVKWGAVWSGVAVLPVGIGACYAGEVLFAWMYGDSSGAPSVLTVGRAMALGVAAFGAVVAARGWWGERERGERRCPKCWYEMGGLAGRLLCPECGHEAKGEADLQRRRRRWGLVAAGGVIVAAAFGVPRLDAVRQGGLKGALPTTVMIAGVWYWPDSWIEDSTRDDRFTLSERLRGDRGWAWQRAWLGSRAEGEAGSPTSITRLERALRLGSGRGPAAEAVAYAGSRLGSKDLDERMAAAALFDWGGPLDVNIEEPDPQLAAALVRRADEIAKGLDSESIDSVFLAAQLLGAAERHTDRVVAAVLRESPRMTGSTWMFAATRLLLRWGGGRPEVVADLVAKSGLGRRAAAQFWHGVSMEATRGEVPRELLERAEEELLTSKDRAVIWAAARVRLSGRHRSPSLEAATAVLAELPGPRRVWSLRALGAAETPGDRNRRSALEREALKSGDPAVLAEALWGVSNQCMRREPGAVCVLGEIQALKGHPDEQVRSAAEEALRVYWAMFEREDP